MNGLACAGETYVSHGKPEVDDPCGFQAECNDWPKGCGWRVDLNGDQWFGGLLASDVARLHTEHLAYSERKAAER